MQKFKKFLEEQNVILKGGSSPKKKEPSPKEEELGEVDTTPTETKTTPTKINEGRYNPETGKIDLVRGDMWHPTDEEYAEYLKNRDQERKVKAPKTMPTPRDPSKPLPYINPQREPRPGDRGPIPFNPDRKPLFPGMEPNPYIKPGLKPVNPSKIPSDMFRPGKRPKGEPNSFGIPTDTDRDDLFPGGLRPKSASEKIIDYYLHQDSSDRFRIGKSPKTDHKRPMDYLETQPMRYGSLPKLGDSNLIGKIPTEQEAYGGRLMSTMKQSQVDLEGNPTGLVKNIPVKPKIDPRYKR